ncbi:MAG: hypothetical protein KGJ13_02535 [Patescibacteria group bacterium]|nr:hypothetical protein [Patescibacteria group bacterium]
MATATLMSLLQAAASLLLFAQGHALPASSTQAIVNFGSNAVQLVTQAAAPIDFSVPQNNGIWPNTADLVQAPYLDGQGRWSRLGSTVQLIPADTSFGDLNGDGLDDAIVVVNRPTALGTSAYYLAAMLNQGGIMFNIADYPLGQGFTMASHTVRDGEAFVNGTGYRLLGNTLLALP